MTSRDLTPFGSIAVCIERQSLFAAVVGRHTAGVALPSVRCSGAGCQGAERGWQNKQVSQQAGLYLQYVEKGVLVPGGAGNLRGRCP
jgi:hypothetical protein